MEELILQMRGRSVDVMCVGAVRLRGEIIKLENEVLYLKDTAQEQTCYVALDKIVAIWEAREEEHRAGFIPTGNNR